jgi:hypothetical protein
LGNKLGKSIGNKLGKTVSKLTSQLGKDFKRMGRNKNLSPVAHMKTGKIGIRTHL